MVRIKNLLIASFVALLTLGSFLQVSLVSAQTESLSDTQKQQIVTNCVSIKNSLNQLHASDALLRVNRGQVYESMASKLMDRFNGRLSSNGLDAKAMTTVTSNYRSALTTFRTNYMSYEQKLSETLRIDCTQNPEAFHEAILETRFLRNTVHEDVLRLHRFIDDYRASVGDFLINYQRITG